MGDRLAFGLNTDGDMGNPEEDDFWFEHPLYPDYVDRYFFSSGDSLVISLPDGRRVVAVELEVVDKRGSYFYYKDESLAQGRESAKRFLRENTDVALEIEAAVRKLLAEDEAVAPVATQNEEAAEAEEEA